MRTERRRMMLQLGNLPSAYQRLEYIVNTNKAYIDTGVVSSNHIAIFYDFMLINAKIGSDIIAAPYGWSAENNWTAERAFGVGIGNNPYEYRVAYGSGQHHYIDKNKSLWGVGDMRGTSWKLKQRYNISLNANHDFCINGEKILSLDGTKKFVGLGTIKFNNNLKKYNIINVYSLIITYDGKPVRNFIPAKRKSDGVIGMYDLVGRKFYTSPNGVAFMGG